MNTKTKGGKSSGLSNVATTAALGDMAFKAYDKLFPAVPSDGLTPELAKEAAQGLNTLKDAMTAKDVAEAAKGMEALKAGEGLGEAIQAGEAATTGAEALQAGLTSEAAGTTAAEAAGSAASTELMTAASGGMECNCWRYAGCLFVVNGLALKQISNQRNHARHILLLTGVYFSSICGTAIRLCGGCGEFGGLG